MNEYFIQVPYLPLFLLKNFFFNLGFYFSSNCWDPF